MNANQRHIASRTLRNGEPPDESCDESCNGGRRRSCSDIVLSRSRHAVSGRNMVIYVRSEADARRVVIDALGL